MPVEHDEHFLLPITVNTTHGYVEVVVTVYLRHTGYERFQHFFQVATAAVGNHLFRNQGCRHRNLAEFLRLVRGCGDGCRETALDLFHHVDEPLGVIHHRRIIRIDIQHLSDIPLGVIGLVVTQVAQRQQTIDAGQHITGKIGKIILQCFLHILYASDGIVLLGLVIDVAIDVSLVLGTDGKTDAP